MKTPSEPTTGVAPADGGAPFFIIGSVRSGTTLVERILNRHPNVVVPPETFFFTFLDRQGLLGPAGGAALDVRHLLERYRGERAFSFLDVPPESDPELLRDARDYRDLFANLMELLRRRVGKRRWGEKTPNNLRYVEPIRRCFPDARFVLVVRDGRAVVLSRLQHPIWRRNLLAAARHWAADAAVMVKLMAELDARSLFVLRFEELLAEPERVVRELCAFLGEAFEPAMLEPQGQEPDADDRYYRQPWMAKSTTGIDPARAKRWLREYTPRALRLVEATAGAQLVELGYPLVNPNAPGWQLLYLRESYADAARRLSNRLSGRSRLSAAARPD